jgi:hypothetical protein
MPYNEATELNYYLRLTFVLSKDDGTTIDRISISFINTMNHAIVLYMYDPTMQTYVFPNILLTPDKEFVYVSLYTILGYLDFLVTKYDMNQLTTNADKQNSIRLNILEVKNKTLSLLPTRIGIVEGGMMSISKIPRTYKYSSELEKDIEKILNKGIDTIFDVCKDKVSTLNVTHFNDALLILFDFNKNYKPVDKPIQDSCTCSTHGWAPIHNLGKMSKIIPSVHDKETQYMLACNFTEFLYINLAIDGNKTIEHPREFYKNAIKEFLYQNKDNIQTIMTECNIGISEKYKNLPIIIGESDPEGCAACGMKTNPQNAYRNGTMYSSYTAASFARKYALADYYDVKLLGAVSWSFEFENGIFVSVASFIESKCVIVFLSSR